MESKRPDRVGDLLLEVISQLLTREVSDPRIGPITLTAAEVTRDLKHARIYFAPLDERTERETLLAGLRSATGFIRSKVARELKLRSVPTIEFVYDEGQDRARRIDDLLKQVKSSK